MVQPYISLNGVVKPKSVLSGQGLPAIQSVFLIDLGMGLIGWLSYRVLAFFRVFSVDPALTWRPRRRKQRPQRGLAVSH